MTSAAGRWRTLDAAELAAEPEARFGGAVAVLFFVAALALTPLMFLVVRGAMDPGGTTWLVLMMGHQAFGGDMKSAFIASSMLQMLALLTWAAIFVAATLLRARSGPLVTAILFAVAAVTAPVGQCAISLVFVGIPDGLYSIGAQLPHMMLNVTAAVAFWAYMQEGRRPNLYFRRRVRTQPPR
jgi:hypothetical protein